MGKPADFLGEGPLTLLGSMMGRLDIELPDFDTAQEWEEWFDKLCEEHIVQTGKYGWEIVEDKEQFLKNMGYMVDELEDDPTAESPYDQYFYPSDGEENDEEEEGDDADDFFGKFLFELM